MKWQFLDILFGNEGHQFRESSRVVVKFCKNVSVPSYMSYENGWNAFDGWFESFVTTDYEIYHMRRTRNIGPVSPGVPDGNANTDHHGSNVPSSSAETSDNNDRQRHQGSTEHLDEEIEGTENLADHMWDRLGDILEPFRHIVQLANGTSHEGSTDSLIDPFDGLIRAVDQDIERWDATTRKQVADILVHGIDYSHERLDRLLRSGDIGAETIAIVITMYKAFEALRRLNIRVKPYLEEKDENGETRRLEKDPERRAVYHIYKVSNTRRERFLGYAIFTTAHLGVFAFLFQVFDDRGAIMQICCYTQLAMLLLCLTAYAFSHLLDIIVVLKMIHRAKYLEEHYRRYDDIHRNGVEIYTHRIFAVHEFEISPQQVEEKRKLLDQDKDGRPISFYESNNFSAAIFDVGFFVIAIMVECLTIAYVYNNTRNDSQQQESPSQ